MILKIDNKIVDLPENLKVKFEFYFPNPLENTIKGNATQWFSFPVTDRNKIIFAHSDSWQISDRVSMYDCKLQIEGIELNGKMFIQTISDLYKCFVSFDNELINYKNKKLNEVINHSIDMGSDTDAIISTAKTMSSGSYPNQKYAFPQIKNKLFYDAENNEQFGWIVNRYENGGYYKNYISSADTEAFNNLSAQPYLMHILELLFSDKKITGSFADDDDIKKLLLYSNFDLARREQQYASTVSLNTNFSEAKEYQWDDPLVLQEKSYTADADNIINDVDGQYSLLTDEYTIATEGLHIIDIKTKLKCTGWGTTISGTGYRIELYVDGTKEDEDFTSQISESYVNAEEVFTYQATNGDIGKKIQLKIVFLFYNFESDSGETYFEYFYIEDTIMKFIPADYINLNRFAKSFNISDIVPKVSVNDFLNELQKKFTIAFFISKKTTDIEIAYLKNIVNSSKAIDLTPYALMQSKEIVLIDEKYTLKEKWSNDDLTSSAFKNVDNYSLEGNYYTVDDLPVVAEVNKIAYVRDVNTYYISYFDNSVNRVLWKNYTSNHSKRIRNTDIEDAKEVEINMTTLTMEQINRFPIIPAIEQKGKSIEYQEDGEAGLKLLFYYGIISDYDASYPIASNSEYGPSGTQISDFGLRLTEANGLYEKFAKDYYDYIESRDKIKMQFAIDSSMLFEIMNLFEPGQSTRKIRVSGRNFLPEKASIIISAAGVEKCEIEMR